MRAEDCTDNACDRSLRRSLQTPADEDHSAVGWSKAKAA